MTKKIATILFGILTLFVVSSHIEETAFANQPLQENTTIGLTSSRTENSFVVSDSMKGGNQYDIPFEEYLQNVEGAVLLTRSQSASRPTPCEDRALNIPLTWESRTSENDSIQNIEMGDGFIWLYTLTQRRNNPVLRLTVTFVCDANDDESIIEHRVVARKIVFWQCDDPDNAVIVEEDNNDSTLFSRSSFLFSGSGGLTCHGESVGEIVGQVIQEVPALNELDFNPAMSVSVPYIYARVQADPATNCQSENPTIFQNENLRTGVSAHETSSGMISISTTLVHYSSSKTLSTTEEKRPARGTMATGMINIYMHLGITRSHSNIDGVITRDNENVSEIMMALNQGSATIGHWNNSDFFCGEIYDLEVDPFSPFSGGGT